MTTFSLVSNGLLSGSTDLGIERETSLSISNGFVQTTQLLADDHHDVATAPVSLDAQAVLSDSQQIHTSSSSSKFVLAPSGLLAGLQESEAISHNNGDGTKSSDAQKEFVPGVPSTHLRRTPIRATTFDGRAVLFNRKLRLNVQPIQTKRMSAEHMGKLLDVPIHRLMEKLSSATAEILSRPISTMSSLSGSLKAADVNLWVDRYRPEKFSDLLGNERAARDVLSWVKGWDWCVFGKRTRASKKRPREDEETFNSNSFKGGKDEDPYRRPKEKLLLLSGPPGLGKTTLAHIVAQQGGYEVMEINASDARSGQIVDDRIRPALESGSAIGSTRPVLLVIDEIDGATGGSDNNSGFIHKLIQLTQDKSRKNKSSRGNSHGQGNRPLLRPIICICNDPFAAALAKLRPIALHIRVVRPADSLTVKRLREVCEQEHLKTESRALGSLVGTAKGDLRACLNTLQFIKTRGEEVTESMIKAATSGMKEADSSVLSVLNSLFAPMTKKHVKELGIGEEEEARFVHRLSREVESSDQINRVASGCFGHYANLKRHDATFNRYEKANVWLGAFDRMSSAMYSGDFTASAYLPYMLIPFYPLFQERGGPRVERNQDDWETHVRTQTNEQIYDSLRRGMRLARGCQAGEYRHFLDGNVLQLEFVPLLNRIISPPLRPVNNQVVKPGERVLLARLVAIMIALELRFILERSEDGQLMYRLDPPIDVFVNYDNKRATDIAVSRYAVRQLVTTEIDNVLIRAPNSVNAGGKVAVRNQFAQSRELRLEQDEDAFEEGNTKPHKLPSHIVNDMRDIVDKEPTDFFGRPILPDLSGSMSARNVNKNPVQKLQVIFKFNEGNSAAVRKPVKMISFA